MHTGFLLNSCDSAAPSWTWQIIRRYVREIGTWQLENVLFDVISNIRCAARTQQPLRTRFVCIVYIVYIRDVIDRHLGCDVMWKFVCRCAHCRMCGRLFSLDYCQLHVVGYISVKEETLINIYTKCTKADEANKIKNLVIWLKNYLQTWASFQRPVLTSC